MSAENSPMIVPLHHVAAMLAKKSRYREFVRKCLQRSARYMSGKIKSL
jgi:hypothetical protein